MSTLGSLSALAVLAAVLVPLSPAEAVPAPTCQGRPATIVGTPEADRLVGTPGDDIVVARDGDDVVLGRGGDDLVCGGDGADTLRGGPGNDRLYGQREALHSDRGGIYFVADLLDGGPDDDVLDAGDDDRDVNDGWHGTFDFSRSATGVTVDLAAGTATGQGQDILVPVFGRDCAFYCHWVTVLGSPYDDELLGSDHGDELVGNAGDDHLVGRGGSDDLGADSRDGGDTAGDDVLEGGPGRDLLTGYSGLDAFYGNGGDDTLWATGGGPSGLHGGTGDDRLTAWFATEPGFVLDGGPGGADSVAVEGPDASGAEGRPTRATVTMQDGRVVADGVEWGRIDGEDVGLYTLMKWEYQGTDAPEIVRSNGTWLRATTYGGDDEIWGTSGRDWIDAGDGVDTVRAGRGRDTCRFAENVRSCELTS